MFPSALRSRSHAVHDGRVSVDPWPLALVQPVQSQPHAPLPLRPIRIALVSGHDEASVDLWAFVCSLPAWACEIGPVVIGDCEGFLVLLHWLELQRTIWHRLP